MTERFILGGFEIDIRPRFINVSTMENCLPGEFQEEPRTIKLGAYVRTKEEALKAVEAYFDRIAEEEI
jgi:hypothetical protein